MIPSLQDQPLPILSHFDALSWLEQIDPGTHRRIKGLRLVTAYGIAAMLGTLLGISHDLPGGASLGAACRRICIVGERLRRPRDSG